MKIEALTGGSPGIQRYKEPVQEAGEATFESRLKKALSENDDKELKKVSQEFEGIFTKILYKQMKATVIKSDFMPESNAKEMFQSMLDEKLAEDSTKAGGIGLGDMMYNQLKKQMSNQYKPK